jgi:hypothetical protein
LPPPPSLAGTPRRRARVVIADVFFTHRASPHRVRPIVLVVVVRIIIVVIVVFVIAYHPSSSVVVASVSVARARE